jgi:hypothetical protein
MREAQLFIVIGAFWTFIVTFIWIVIGWRAMKAHERLAASVDEIRQATRAYVKDRLQK